MCQFYECLYIIVFGKFNIQLPHFPVYIRKVQSYSQKNKENIKYAISNFNWSKAFENLPVDGKVKRLNKTLLFFFRNYIPNKKIHCDYLQSPWINDNIKPSLKQRPNLTEFFYKNGLKKSDHFKVLEKSTDCTKNILEAKKTIYLE